MPHCSDNFYDLNRHGRIQDILSTHGHENTAWFFQHGLVCFHGKETLNFQICNTETVCTCNILCPVYRMAHSDFNAVCTYV